MVRDDKSELAISHLRKLADKSRNERQKAMLLSELAKLSSARASCEESARLMAKSKDLCEKAKELSRAKKRA